MRNKKPIMILGVAMLGFFLWLSFGAKDAEAQRGPRVLDDGTRVYADYENRMLLAHEIQASALRTIAGELKKIRLELRKQRGPK